MIVTVARYLFIVVAVLALLNAVHAVWIEEWGRAALFLFIAVFEVVIAGFLSWTQRERI